MSQDLSRWFVATVCLKERNYLICAQSRDHAAVQLTYGDDDNDVNKEDVLRIRPFSMYCADYKISDAQKELSRCTWSTNSDAIPFGRIILM